MNKQRLPLSLILLLSLLVPGLAFGQTGKGGDTNPVGGGLPSDAIGFCTDFTNGMLNGWQSNPADPDDFAFAQPGASGDPGDTYLEVTEKSDVTFLQNLNNYDGNWLNIGSCFCFDVLSISGVQVSTPLRFTLVITGGVGGQAEFEFNQTVDSTMGWTTLCAPIETCTGGNLPANEFGQWELAGGSTSCNTWNSIVSNVTSVRIEYDDINFTNEVTGFDNICLGTCQDESRSCCDDTPNEIFNGNFELGNTGFNSQYTFTNDLSPNSIAPGMYSIGTSPEALAVSPNWIVDDPSGCSGLDNDRFMLVNGRTQQSGSGLPPIQLNSRVWEQSIPNLTAGSTYQFCGKFKNLPQTAFDILPEVFIEILTPFPQTFGPVTINTSPDPCDWQEISFQVEMTNAANTTADIRIYVDQLGNGDGNDLAIDDLAFHEIGAVDFDMTVTGTTNPNGPDIEGSFGNAGSGDDGTFDASCNFLWTVLNSLGNPIGSGNSSASSIGPPWPLTTTFPGINFQSNITYRIELELSDCDCAADGLRWAEIKVSPSGIIQVTNSGARVHTAPEPEQSTKKSPLSDQIHFFPNPSTGMVHAEIGQEDTQIQLVDLQGRVLREWNLSGNRQLDLSAFPAGAYYLQYQSLRRSGAHKVILQ